MRLFTAEEMKRVVEVRETWHQELCHSGPGDESNPKMRERQLRDHLARQQVRIETLEGVVAKLTVILAGITGTEIDL